MFPKLAILFLALLPGFSLAQSKATIIRSEQDTLYFQVLEKVGKLALDYTAAQLKPTVFTKKHIMALTRLQLDDADLVIHYQLGPSAAEQYYKTSISIYNGKKVVVSPSPHQVSGNIGSLPHGLSGAQSISWLDAMEDVLVFGQKHSLVLSTELWGVQDCPPVRPVFGFQQQVPHLGIAAGGLILTGVGQLEVIKKNEAYRTYIDVHTKGDSKELANDFLKKAERYEDSARLFTYSGWAILGLNSAVYLYRALSIKAQQKKYDKDCQEDLLSMSLEPIRLGDGSSNLQFKIAFTFK